MADFLLTPKVQLSLIDILQETTSVKGALPFAPLD
jgi:hypothetical protein